MSLPSVFDERFGSLQDQVNRLFGNLLGEHLSGRTMGPEGWVPALDAVELPEHVVVTLEAPGVDPKDIDIAVVRDQLEITGTKKVPETPKESRWYHLERSGGKFRRVVGLPVPVDAEHVEAESRNGLLTVRLPKKAEVRPKRIEVKVH